MIDVARALKLATDTGDVRFGLREVRRAVRSKSAKLVVLASNCPESPLGDIGSARVHRFTGTNMELGSACGVPFPVAAVAILSPGESNILSL
ncbi:MAG TPA: 50S ribosomal protein L30e [Thermoplasmata archaeon]|nr:50S ribosomal protein L30e [Thermoplasmata archaeon]